MRWDTLEMSLFVNDELSLFSFYLLYVRNESYKLQRFPACFSKEFGVYRSYHIQGRKKGIVKLCT